LSIHLGKQNRDRLTQLPELKKVRTTTLQKIIAFITLVLLAVILHGLFCEWKSGVIHQYVWPEEA